MSRCVALEARDQKIVDRLVEGHSQHEIAAELGCSRRTVGRRLQSDRVRQALQLAVAEKNASGGCG